jgi:hypothetical protein
MATRVLNEHTNDHDLCAVCGCAWPCARAELAEHNLAFLQRDAPSERPDR